MDPSVLEILRADLDDDGVWKIFVRNFIEYLPHRNERLRLTLTTGDLAGALDAVLSLKTSSQMVGAARLASLAVDLERSIRAGTLDEANPAVTLPRLAAAHLMRIKQCSRQTIHGLKTHQRQQPDYPDASASVGHRPGPSLA
jgi:HPt (histidine-containing phosphotransfer) domain-containing protein